MLDHPGPLDHDHLARIGRLLDATVLGEPIVLVFAGFLLASCGSLAVATNVSAGFTDVFRTLATESLEDRKFNPGLEEQRADVIVGGCCVLVSVFRYFGFDECLVSEADILDGLVMSQFD